MGFGSQASDVRVSGADLGVSRKSEILSMPKIIRP